MVGGIDNDVRNQKRYDVIVGGELFTDYSDHPRKSCHAKTQNSNQQAPDATTSLSRWWDAYRKQLYLKDFSPKSQDGIAQIKERGFTYD